MYEEYLDEIFKSKENFGALPHCKRYEILKGDASKTVKNFLRK